MSFTLVVLADFEASFIRLVNKITNGSIIEVNETGKYHQNKKKTIATLQTCRIY